MNSKNINKIGTILSVIAFSLGITVLFLVLKNCEPITEKMSPVLPASISERCFECERTPKMNLSEAIGSIALFDWDITL